MTHTVDMCPIVFAKVAAWICFCSCAVGDFDRRASLYLRLIKTPAPCCTLAMASCLCSLSNRKWPPLCCCCRLKAHRLARRPKPPFWSQRTESRQQRRERRKGGHGAEVRDSMVVVMAKEQWGKMAGREKELKHGDHSFRVPRSYPQQGYERRGRRALLSLHRG